MLEESILKAIEKEIQKGNNEFFGYAWREKLNEISDFLEEESKYARLVEWINEKIKLLNSTKNVFCPADKNEDTTLTMVNTYLKQMENLAVLIHCKELLNNIETDYINNKFNETEIKELEELKEYLFKNAEIETTENLYKEILKVYLKLYK